MKLLVILALAFSSFHAYGQTTDQITGKWLKTPNEDLIIEVYKINDEYRGKINWSNDSVKRPVGFVILDQLKYNPDTKKWENGKVHVPNSGKTYNATVKVIDNDELELQAYPAGLKFMGRKKNFKRTKK